MELVQSRVVFNQESHTYTLDGRELQGITGMLSRQLFPDKYCGVPESVLQKAAERGTFVHENCELADSLGIVPANTEARNYLRLKRQYNLTTAASEYLVSDNEHFASCIDKVFDGGGGVFHLGDIKTTYSLDTEYVSWQLSVYAYLFEMQNPGARAGSLYAIWLRGQRAEIVEVARKPAEAVKELLQCEIEGRQYGETAATTAVTQPGTLPKKYKALEQTLIGIDAELQELQRQKKELLAVVEDAMRAASVKKWETDSLQLVVKADSTRTDFDRKAFEEEHPDLYGKYVKYTAVKGGLTMRIKN